MSKGKDNNAPSTPRRGYEAEDFYHERGFLVFTEAYHLKRGYCCKSVCRHCPYGYKKN